MVDLLHRPDEYIQPRVVGGDQQPLDGEGEEGLVVVRRVKYVSLKSSIDSPPNTVA